MLPFSICSTSMELHLQNMCSLPTACKIILKNLLPVSNGYACLTLPVEILDRYLSGGDIDLELLLECVGVGVFQ